MPGSLIGTNWPSGTIVSLSCLVPDVPVRNLTGSESFSRVVHHLSTQSSGYGTPCECVEVVLSRMNPACSRAFLPELYDLPASSTLSRPNSRRRASPLGAGTPSGSLWSGYPSPCPICFIPVINEFAERSRLDIFSLGVHHIQDQLTSFFRRGYQEAFRLRRELKGEKFPSVTDQNANGLVKNYPAGIDREVDRKSLVYIAHPLTHSLASLTGHGPGTNLLAGGLMRLSISREIFEREMLLGRHRLRSLCRSYGKTTIANSRSLRRRPPRLREARWLPEESSSPSSDSTVPVAATEMPDAEVGPALAEELYDELFADASEAAADVDACDDELAAEALDVAAEVETSDDELVVGASDVEEVEFKAPDVDVGVGVGVAIGVGIGIVGAVPWVGRVM